MSRLENATPRWSMADRARKHTLFNKYGGRFVETSRSPLRHSFVDVRVLSVCSGVLYK